MNIDDAWNQYLQECEEMRQLFLQDPMIEKYPKLKESAHFVLLQTQAMAYNQVMAPQQTSPAFSSHHYLEPIIYTAHQPNPDFVYQIAFLDGTRRWRITGRRNNAHWVDIQSMRGWWGEPEYGAIQNYDLDQDFEVRPDGTFEIIASAEPSPGNWIRLDSDHRRNTLMTRPAMYDWANEMPPEFYIEPADGEPCTPVILEPEEITRRVLRCGEYMKHAIGIWTTKASPKLLKRVGMNNFVTYRGDSSRGGANPLAQYGQAVFELGQNEALIIETDKPDASYWGLSLGTWWWETIDPTHHKSSINGHQAVFDRDGKFRAVLAHQDPGIPNWLDPAGWEVGIILLRWYRAKNEQRITTKKVPISELREHLPRDTPVVTPHGRKAEINGRRHGFRRWYGYATRSSINHS